ncbi:hypothetical protein R6Q59_030427 [Mikania micrantha]
MLQETWVELIDKLFSTSKHANRCAKNKSNKEKQRYGSYHESQSLVSRRHKEVKETGHADYIKGWEEMHYKKGKWISEKASQDWDKISSKYNESLLKSGGNKALVNEVECLTEALGPMRSHIKGVGRKLKSVTPDTFPNANRHEVDERLLRQEKALEDVQQQNELLKQQNELLKQQMNYLLKVTDTQFPSSSRQLNEDDDEEDVYRPVFSN